MKFDKKRILKKFSYTTLIVLGALMTSAYVLRSVYAISLFEGMQKMAGTAGWKETDSDSVVQVGEGMTFEASYLFFKIGAVNFKVLGKTTYDGCVAYRLQSYIESYSGVPFVNLHATYDTYADSSTLMCLSTSNTVKDGNSWFFTKTQFDFAKKVVNWTQAKDGKQISAITIPFHRNYTDGVSFFYYLRRACRLAGGKRTSLNIPIIVDTTRSSVDLTIDEKTEPCRVEAFKYPIESNRVSGHINFTGFFGVTGNFVGWISADPGEVPLKADVNVILGSVVVKLKSIDKTGWYPPRATGG